MDRPTLLHRKPLLYSSGGLLLLALVAGAATLAFAGPTADPAQVGLALRVGADAATLDSLAALDPDDLDAVGAAALGRARADAEPQAWIGGEPFALHEDVVPFYHARALAPIWADRALRDTLLHALGAAGLDGLNPEAYRLGALAEAAAALDARDPREEIPLPDTAAADLDLGLTDALFRFADDLAGARTDPEAIYGDLWRDARSPTDVPAGLARALGAEAPATAMADWIASLAPPHAGYRHLRAALARKLDGTGPDSVSADLLRLNLERWRWLPRDLGERHVFVNVPAYHLWLRDGGEDVFDMKVVVGSPGRWQTPALTDTMETIVFSPIWIIPASIQRESYGFVTPGRVKDPGPGNPMGRAKFLFPNDHAVYIHDTNSKWGFSREYRALSHGCVRAADPRDFATAVLTRTNGWDPADVAERFEGAWASESVEVETDLPVHLVYFTAWADPDGTVHLPDDVYRRDPALADALGLTL